MTAAEYRAKYARTPPASDRLTPSECQDKAGKGKPVKLPKSAANQITAAAILWLNLNGFKAYRVNNGSVFDPAKKIFRKNKHHTAGIPDIGGFCKSTGRALFIEVKAGKDRLSPAQIQFLKEAESAGCITGCIRSSAEIETIIQKF